MKRAIGWVCAYVLLGGISVGWAEGEVSKAKDERGSAPKRADGGKNTSSRPVLREIKKVKGGGQEGRLRLLRFRTLHARFVQRQHYAFMQAPMVSEGRLYLGADRMVWQIDRPTESRIVLEGTRGYLYYPRLGVKKELKHGQHEMMGAIGRNLALLCRADLAGLSKMYRVVQKGGDWELVPRSAGMQKVIARLQIRLDGRGFVRQVVVFAPDGDRMEVEFSKIKLDQPWPREFLTAG